MKYLVLIGTLLIGSLAFASAPAPYPLFLKSGFSSVIEFNEAPSQVVLGDSQSFQIEKLNRSLAIKCNNPNTSSNMFVYFNGKEPYIFILTSSDDAEPTYYRKFDFPEKKILAAKPKATIRKRSFLIESANFNNKKDLLTVDVLITADASSKITPAWHKVRLHYAKKEIKPKELWSEREVIQKDSVVKARFSFLKPDVPRNLRGATLSIPTNEDKAAVQIKLSGRL